ncbi:MAG: polysaccharide deacetylase family protein [bacterium]
MFKKSLSILILLAAAWVPTTSGGPAPRRLEVAITFDDLPVISTLRDDKSWAEITNKLLTTFKQSKAPVIGFVNETKLYSNNELDPARVALLQTWLDAGLELGNHSYSHHSLNSTPLADFEADVLRGEALIRGMMAQRQKQLRYFRHPFLHTGRSVETRDQFVSFLHSHGYSVAPVTIDNSEWIFARAYDNARDANDSAAMKQVADAYVPYMEAKFAYYEQQSRKLFGRDIKQVLLVHANAINADHFKDIVALLQQRGYKFITLEAALTDKAYASPDTFIGAGGISWLDRWALTRGVPKDFFKGEPTTPAFVLKLAKVESE